MDKFEVDKKIVEKLSNKKYADWVLKIRKSLQKDGSPLNFKSGIWTVGETVEKRKAIWQSLGTMLFDEHLDRFGQIVVDVLKEPDPKFELPAKDRYLANIHGKNLKHSSVLRKGLAESLALLGAYPEALKYCSSGKAEAIAITSVREIFKDADWILWGSLNDLLPTLAEAAPNEFLHAVENALNKKPCPFDELFSQQSSGITGANYTTGLLWALETLAWDEQYLMQTTVLFGKLATRDGGGNWGNRPDKSLSTIFLPGFLRTVATVAKRKAAVKALQKECPEIGWKLLLDLLPNQHQISTGTYKPVWRQIIPDGWKEGVTGEEYWEQVSFYSGFAVEAAKGDFIKLNELISNLDNLPEPYFDKFLEYLKSKEVKDSSEENRTPLWTELVKFTIKHRKFSDAKWAFPPEIIEKIDQVAKALAPKEPKNLHKRLFDNYASALYEKQGSYEEQDRKLVEYRQDAVNEIIADGGITAVLEFAETVGFPNEIGNSLGVVAKDDVDSVILPALLETKNEKLAQLTRGFIWTRCSSKGWEWVNQIGVSSWSIIQIGEFLSCLPFVKETWEYSEKLLGKFEVEYWSRANVNHYLAEDNLDIAIDMLIQYGRPNAALNCLFEPLFTKKLLDKKRAVIALLEAVSSGNSADPIDTYNVVEIIKALQDDPEVNQDDLFKIEWAYLPLLTGPGKQASTKLLERKLASEPEFFCEAIRLLFRSKNEPESDKEPMEQKKMMAENVWRLFSDWGTLPGAQLEGSFSADDFNHWLKSVKEKCESSGHLEVALSTIGGVLIHYIPDPDGLWIHRALAEALNAEDADRMRNGFSIGIMNSRGAHFVDPTGKPEKELAAKYKKQADDVENAGYYRLAATLRGLEKFYKGEAKRIVEEIL